MPKRIDTLTFNCGQKYHNNGCCFEKSAKPGQKFFRKAELLNRFNGNSHATRHYASQHLNMTGNEYILALEINRKGK